MKMYTVSYIYMWSLVIHFIVFFAAHPKIRLFIYQGGLQSTEEAIYNAVPLIGLPVIADQFTHINKMVSLGVAKYLNYQDISKEIVNESITDILNDKR